MKEKIVYEILNRFYRFKPRALESPRIKGYLVVFAIGKDKNQALMEYFEERFIPHKEAIKFFKDNGTSVKKVYTGGNLVKLAELKGKFNHKPIKKVLGELEETLLN
ncbi:MAG: hypothetical protein Q7R52_04085 [archaeon]|nr:hypothetical protein [archaeon]